MKDRKTSFASILFVIVIVINYLSSAGIIFPYTQSEVSDMHTNLLAPAGFAFSIWSVIYLGVAITLLTPLVGWGKEELRRDFEDHIASYYIAWMVLNAIWIITWSYDWIFVSLLAIVAYAIVLTLAAKNVDRHPSFDTNRWLVTYPLGLHAGWLLTASYANIMTLLAKNNVDVLGDTGVWLTIGLMVLIVATVAAVYYWIDNVVLMVPALWALFGIFMKHREGSDFQYNDSRVMIAAIVLLVVGFAIHQYILRKVHRPRREARA